MIVDLSCPIELRGYELLRDDNGSTRAYIRLYNLSEKTVVSYSATTRWYNGLTREDATENITVDEMRVAARSAFKLVHSTQSEFSADHVEMYFSSVGFDDGEVWTPKDGDLVEIGEQPVLEGEEMDLLRAAAGDDAVQFPQVQNKYWRCVCGRINLLETDECVRCGRGRQYVLKHFNARAVLGGRSPRPEHADKGGTGAQKDRTGAEKTPKRRRRSNAPLVALLIALIIVLLALVGYGVGREMSGRPDPEPTPAYYNGGAINL